MTVATATLSRRHLIAGAAGLGLTTTACAAAPAPQPDAPQDATRADAEARSMRNRLRAGEVTYGVGVTIPSPAVTQLLAAAGFDWIFVDLEHGPISVETAHAMIAATAGTALAPWVRIPHPLPWLAKPLLDAGASGVVFPTILTAADATTAARACRYPPHGDRGWGPFYAPARFGTSMPNYLATADDAIVTVVIIEEPEAVRNIQAIVEVPGVDVAVIGTHDLATSIGRAGQLDHPDVRALVERAEKVIAGSDVALGGNAFSTEQAAAMAGRGYQVIALGFDWTLLQRGAAGILPQR